MNSYILEGFRGKVTMIGQQLTENIKLARMEWG
jgi:hypothetical protein